MRTVAFCEIDPFCRRVLAKHWPAVPCYTDVRELTADRLRADGIAADVICGGFPCQDISIAGSGAGIDGARSGLWSEYSRLIGEVQPRFVIVENVAALLGRGMDRVLGDLAALGYDAEWHCIRAADLGAPHLRDRVWIVAYPQHPDTDRLRSHRTDLHQHGSAELRDEQIRFPGSICEDVAHAVSKRLEGRPFFAGHLAFQLAALERSRAVLHADRTGPFSGALGGVHREEEGAGPRNGESQRLDWWLSEPDVGRVAHGVPSRVDRLRSLGNAVVPQIPEIIGRAIMSRVALASAERQPAQATP